MRNHYLGDTTDAEAIIAFAFDADHERVALAMKEYRMGFRVVLPYGSIARLGSNHCCYWTGTFTESSVN
jgi:hypothetical protein